VIVLPPMASLWADVRYAVRGMFKEPGVNIVALICIALGIGANTAIFSVLNALLIRPLPVLAPEQLVKLSTLASDAPNRDNPVSLSMFEQLRKDTDAFSGLFAYDDSALRNLEASSVKYSGSVVRVSGEYFSVLGVRPLVGRLIEAGDVNLGSGTSSQVAVLGYRCWEQYYGKDPNILGKPIFVDGIPLSIIGVTPSYFAGLSIDSAYDAAVPIGFAPQERKNGWFSVTGRLKAGITVEKARAQVATIWPGILSTIVSPRLQGGQRQKFLGLNIKLQSFARGTSYLRDQLSKPLTIVMYLVGLVLLIACVNLATILLARATAQSHDLGVRSALGASAWDLVRPLVTHGLLLAVLGGLIGVLFASQTSPMLIKMTWVGRSPVTIDTSPDIRVLVFTAGVAICTGIFFSILPVWQILRSNPASALGRKSRSVHRGVGMSKLLITAQVAMCLGLTTVAALFGQSLSGLRSADVGFQRSGVLSMELFPQAGRERVFNRTEYYQRLAKEVSDIPGVQSASYSEMVTGAGLEIRQPVSVSTNRSISTEAVQERVGPGFFHMIGMRVLAGREFTWQDNEAMPRVAIISESLARRLFPSESPQGQRIDIGDRPDQMNLEIVGLVNSASLWKVQSRAPEAVYTAFLQDPNLNQPALEVRTLVRPTTMIPKISKAIESSGYHYGQRAMSLDERLDLALVNERMISRLSAFFASLALLLSAVGLYGLVSYSVAQRTSEIGVRMALGADKGGIFYLVVREAMLYVLLGVLMGIPCAFAASRLAAGMLFGVAPHDPLILSICAALLLLVTLLAAYVPARRAARLDPLVALRVE